VFRIVSSTRLVIAMLTGLALALTGITAATAAAAAPAGTVVGWGNNGSGQATPPAGLTGVVGIAAGYVHSLALTSDGTVVGWGWNGYGQATPPAGLTGVTAIAAGEMYSLALTSDGTVVGWGYNLSGQATPPAGLTGVTAIAAGYYHGLALKNDGTVVGWGNNDYGQATPPAGLTGVVGIAAGGYHSLALTSDGTVVGWGNNGDYGQATPPAGLTGVVAIAASFDHSLALTSDGTVVGWGNNRYGQATPPAGLTGVTAIAAGEKHSLALTSDGTVVGWGYNFYGQATPPAGLTGVTAIAAGYYHSLALTSDGTVDVVPPVLTVPAAMTVEATGPTGALASFTATAVDNTDPNPTVACTPGSGAAFPLGPTPVECTARDATGNTATGGFTVTVVDTTAPMVTPPADVTVEATGPAGAPVTFTAGATDLVDPNPTVTCSPASGAAFLLGPTPVECTARDATGNTATGGFTVTVVDTRPPVLTLPANQTVIAAGPGGATVTWPAPTANDAVSGSRPVACTPASGTLFPLGVTLVHCAAADLAGNTANGSFSVTVGYAYRTVSVSMPFVGGVAAFGVQLVDRTGHNISSGTIGLRAVTIDGHVLDPKISKAFTYSSLLRSYGYALSTTGLARGKHTLGFTAGTDPATHDITFTVR